MSFRVPNQAELAEIFQSNPIALAAALNKRADEGGVCHLYRLIPVAIAAEVSTATAALQAQLDGANATIALLQGS